MSPANETAIRSYAKVNLTLDVLGKRADGFHAIESVMQSVGLHDSVTLSIGGKLGVRLACDAPGVPTGEANLAHRAASVLFERRGLSAGLDIRIEKRIPPEAGLGGGSSNAAAVLRGLDHLLGFSMSRAELCYLAAGLGSDVPFFIVGGTAFARGRGEEVEPLPDIRTWWLVIVKPPFGVSTALAYRYLDEMRLAGESTSRGPAAREQLSGTERMTKCIERRGCEQLPALLGNDLELPTLRRRPEIARIRDALQRVGARATLMCGSGSAAFGLFESEDAARAAADKLGSQQIGDLFVERTITREEALAIE